MPLIYTCLLVYLSSLLIHLFVHLFINPSIHPSIQPSIHPLSILYRPLTYHTFIHSSIHTIQSSFLLFIHPTIHPMIINSFIHLSRHKQRVVNITCFLSCKWKIRRLLWINCTSRLELPCYTLMRRKDHRLQLISYWKLQRTGEILLRINNNFKSHIIYDRHMNDIGHYS